MDYVFIRARREKTAMLTMRSLFAVTLKLEFPNPASTCTKSCSMSSFCTSNTAAPSGSGTDALQALYSKGLQIADPSLFKKTLSMTDKIRLMQPLVRACQHLTEVDKSTWHFRPKDSDNATHENVSKLLQPPYDLTDALASEKCVTLSSHQYWSTLAVKSSLSKLKTPYFHSSDR